MSGYNENKLISYIVVDDHPFIRAGVKSYLTLENNFQFLGEADNGLAVANLVQQYQPDLVLLDLNLPGLPGNKVIQQLSANGCKAKIIVLSAYEDTEYIIELMRMGAAGYVLKRNLGYQLVEAAQSVIRGESWLSPQLSGKLITYQNKSQNFKLENLLTPREIDILREIATGLENDEIAEQLNLSKSTVQNHISTIYSKINVHTRPRAILLALKQGLVDLEKISLS